MPPNTITPPPPTDPGSSPTLGGGGGNWLSEHKGAAIGGAIGLLALIYLYSKSKSSSSQAGATPSVYELAPGTQLSGTSGGTGQGGGGGGQLSSALEQLEQEIAAQTQAIQALPGPSGTTTTPGSTGANSGSVLPELNYANFPDWTVGPSQPAYTQVGSEVNGIIQPGTQAVLGGAPVYGAANGGYFQGGTLNKTYTGNLYIPTSLAQEGY